MLTLLILSLILLVANILIPYLILFYTYRKTHKKCHTFDPIVLFESDPYETVDLPLTDTVLFSQS
jgi:hypothetical protein